MLNAPAALNERYGIPDVVRFDAGAGGLTRLVVTTEHADAHVYLHVPDVTHYQPCGQPAVLWVSERTAFQIDRPIRGGVPVIFPWFGPKRDDPSQPLHGFARVREWAVRDVTRRARRRRRRCHVRPQRCCAHPPASWPHKFALTYVVTIGRTLETALTVRNEGKIAFGFEEVLHPYFAVGDVRRIAIRGLRAMYRDKNYGTDPITDDAERLTFARVTDRVYRNTRDVHDRRPGHRPAHRDREGQLRHDRGVESRVPAPRCGRRTWDRTSGRVSCASRRPTDHAITAAGGGAHARSARADRAGTTMSNAAPSRSSPSRPARRHHSGRSPCP